ncbi:MAG: broad specificity phosphatase PhoE [Gammaproteobacteria bacterium]|jgi:broad specificity phosphatase PhoE
MKPSLQLPDSLKNQYYVMRHGESLANTVGIIVSHPDHGICGYGLSEVGRQQVTAEISACKLTQSTRIICSDFKRAHETAKIAHRILACQCQITLDERLRERNFGELELGSDRCYAEVWSADQQQVNRSDKNVETVESVLYRALDLILELESEFSDISFLLIAHGDVLQILQTAFSELPVHQHRQLPHLKTAEIRQLNLPTGHPQ